MSEKRERLYQINAGSGAGMHKIKNTYKNETK